MTSYHELDAGQKFHVDSKMSAVGVNPARLTPDRIDELLESYEPVNPDLARWHKYNNLTVAQRRARQMQDEANRKPGDGLPTADEARDIAKKFHVNINHIATKEQAIAEAETERRQQQDFDDLVALQDAIKNQDVVTLVEIGKTSTDEKRMVARAAMAEILPSFEWGDD